MSTEHVRPRMLLHIALKLKYIDQQQAHIVLQTSSIEEQLATLLGDDKFDTVRLLFILKSILKIAEHKSFISRVEYIHLLDNQFTIAQKNSRNIFPAVGEKLNSPLLVRIVNLLVKASILSNSDKDFILDKVAKEFSSVHRPSRSVSEIDLDKEETISLLRKTSPIPIVPKSDKRHLKNYNVVKKISDNEYLALDQNNQGVVMEVFPQEINIESVHQFQEKIKSLCTLKHKNIVEIYEFGFYPSYHQYALIKEYVNGATVKQMVDKHEKLTVPLSLKIIYYVLTALRHAQTQNIIHGNVRPQNITITDDKSTKLSGFCLDRIVSQQEMKASNSDAYFYMSLEQIQSPENIDQRSDIYNAGACLYFMLSGRPPYFECRNMYEIATAYIQDRKPAILTGIASEVVQVVNKAIAINKKDRYQTLLAMQSDIKKLL